MLNKNDVIYKKFIIHLKIYIHIYIHKFKKKRAYIMHDFLNTHAKLYQTFSNYGRKLTEFQKNNRDGFYTAFF